MKSTCVSVVKFMIAKTLVVCVMWFHFSGCTHHSRISPNNGATTRLPDNASVTTKYAVNMFPVSVHSTFTAPFGLLASPSMTVHQVKVLILEKSGLSVDKQRLLVEGTELTDETKTLDYYKMTGPCIVEIIQL